MLAIVVVLTGLGFVALVTAFVADRFIRADAELEEREDRVLAELHAIGQRLERVERNLSVDG